MPSSAANNRSTKEIPLVRPIQPTQSWTFENALLLFRSPQDRYTLDALDEFLLLNSSVYLSPSPFKGFKETEKVNGKEFSLRNVLYTDISPTNHKDCDIVSKLLNLQYQETLRNIKQTCMRIPEQQGMCYEKFNSKLLGDKEKLLEEERVLFYAGRILRERRLILRTVVELLGNKSNSEQSKVIQNLGKEIYLSEAYINDLLLDLETSLDLLSSRNYRCEYSEEVNKKRAEEIVLFVQDQMKVLVELLAPRRDVNRTIVNSWFKIMDKYNFIVSIGSFIDSIQSFLLLQALSTIISLLLLDLEGYHKVDDPQDFQNDADTFIGIHQAVTNSEYSNTIIMYSWMLILLRKSVLLEENFNTPSSLHFMKKMSLKQINQSMRDLTFKSKNVFSDISKLNDLLKFDNIYPAILSTLILAALPLVTMTPEIATTISEVLSLAPDSIVEKFFANQATANAIILARAKFPISLIPFLRFCSINGNFAFREFSQFKSYMYLFDKFEFEKCYRIDDEDTELVRLTKGLNLYPPFEVKKRASFFLAEGTKGKVLPAAKELEVLVTFLYDFNGWAFLGRVLQNVSKVFDGSDYDKVTLVQSILSVMSRLMLDCSEGNAKQILEDMSAFTDNSDIVEIIFGLLEQGLHSRNIQILKPILDFLGYAMPLISNRIWQYLSKSSLFLKDGKEGQSSLIFGATEMVVGDYQFSIALIKFIDALVQSCLSVDDPYPEKNKRLMLERVVGHLIQIFESFMHCNFNEFYQRMEMGVLILDIFSGILGTVCGTDIGPSSQKVFRVYASASSKIIDLFLIPGSDTSRTLSPIISMIDSLEGYISHCEINDISGFWYDNWIRCSLAFAELLISIRNEKKMLPSAFEMLLFNKLPLLVGTYSQFYHLRKDILDLITSLTNAKWKNHENPSLLSHLGRAHAGILLNSILTDMDNDFDDCKVKISLYDFICSVMDGNQEGLSVLFINGGDIFGDFTRNTERISGPSSYPSILSVLKRNIKDVKYYPTYVSLHLVDALLLVLNSWSTARTNENDIEFVNDLISRVQLQKKIYPTTTEDYVATCYELKLSAKIFEILSLILFTTKNETCKNNILNLITSDEFISLSEEYFSIVDYKPNLHSNLKIRFDNTYSGFDLYQFTSCLTKRNRFGYASIYNLPLMDRLFSKTKSWPEVREQVISSSINFQYIRVQSEVSKSLGALYTALCRKYPASLTGRFASFAVKLLKLNVNEGPPITFLESLYLERIEVSFFITYTICNTAEVKKNSKDAMQAIKACSELLICPPISLLNTSREKNKYYKPVLRILYCNLNLVKSESMIIIENTSVFRDLFDLVIARFTKILLIEIQNEFYLSHVENKEVTAFMNEKLDDLKLIFSILKAFCGLKAPTKLFNEMEIMIRDNDTIKSLFNLFSFSHLGRINNELIFAHISLMFIQELMTIEVLCQRIVSSGLFIVLSQSKVSEIIQSSRTSEISLSEYHGVWVNGILPIFLTALSKLGANAVLEVSMALRSFSSQFEACIENWSQSASTIRINSAMVAETSQVLLLFNILKAMNVGDSIRELLPSKKSPSTESEIDMAILPGLDTDVKREHFANCIDNLLKHPKFLSSRVIPSTPEEQRIFEKGEPYLSKFLVSLISDIRDMKKYVN